jgi:DNA-binding transcriptional LysR family regulator
MSNIPSSQQLENFMIYGRVGNFTLAAKQANITQSAFSFQMKNLEAMLNVNLISRSNRGSKLTPEGEFFFKKLSQIMPMLAAAIYDVQHLNGEKPLELKIGVLTSLGDVLMNQHISYFHENNSNILITVYNMEEEDLLTSLNDDRIDIVSTFLRTDLTVKNYEKVLFRLDDVVYYAPNIPKIKNAVSLQQMEALPLVQYPSHSFMNGIIEKYFQHSRKILLAAARLATPYAIVHYCQQNPAGALLPKRLLRALQIEDGYYEMASPLQLKAYLLYKKENPKSKIMQVFIDYIINLNRDFC